MQINMSTTICFFFYFVEFCGRPKISNIWLSEDLIWLLLKDSGFVVISFSQKMKNNK